jgi:hypothetical protein
MFSSLVRWFECGAANRQPRRFAPRLEALDGRVLPGGCPGGVVMKTGDLTLSQVSSINDESGKGGFVSTMHIGEEIPQTTRASLVTEGVWASDNAQHGGHVDNFGCRGGLGGEV